MKNGRKRGWVGKQDFFMSGFAENAIIHDGKLDDGVHLLSSPFRKADLALVVHDALTFPRP